MAAEKEFGKFYRNRKIRNLYPTEFVVRTFLGQYPGLALKKDNYSGKKILDLGFGDGRNLSLLRDLEFEIYGVETSTEIVDMAREYIDSANIIAQLSVGRNSDIPFTSELFDFVLACHSCYYIDNGETFDDNLGEISRVIKPGGVLVASVPMVGNYILKHCKQLGNGYSKITNDPYQLRNGCILKYFASKEEIESSLSTYFENFSFGFLDDEYYGIRVKACIFVCNRK